jgi:hypothetical protein
MHHDLVFLDKETIVVFKKPKQIQRTKHGSTHLRVMLTCKFGVVAPPCGENSLLW